MSNKRKYPSRQVRRAAERRIAKGLVQKEQAQNANQDRSDTQESDRPKRRIDWKSISRIIGSIVKLIDTILDKFPW